MSQCYDLALIANSINTQPHHHCALIYHSFLCYTFMAASGVTCSEPMFWIYLVISIALVSFAGLMSGLTLGLMSLSLVDLEVLAKAGQPQDRKNAG